MSQDHPERDPSMLLAADALDATEAFERALVERAIGDDRAAARELASFAETAALLGWAAAEPPPPALRDAVLAATRTTRQLPPLVRPRRTARRRRLLLAAALAVVAAVGGSLALVRQDDRSPADEVAAVLAGADRVVTLRGTAPGEVRVAHGRDDGALTVLAEGVPVAEPGMTYQLWLVTDDGTTHSAGLFTGAAETDGGPSTTRLGRPTDAALERLTALAVTVEPARGSPTPTGEVRYRSAW